MIKPLPESVGKYRFACDLFGKFFDEKINHKNRNKKQPTIVTDKTIVITGNFSNFQFAFNESPFDNHPCEMRIIKIPTVKR